MPTPSATDAAARFEVYLLDMGLEKYGDCLVIRAGNRTILVDAGHLNDHKPRGGFESIPQQLAAIFGHEAPHEFDLVVVTHCHGDHIGCLPKLVGPTADLVRAKWVLAADENLGWGVLDGDAADSIRERARALPEPARRAFAGLREEPPDAADDAALADLLAEADKMVDDYPACLGRLKSAGARLIRYRGQSMTALENAFSDIGLDVLGPTRAQLESCARVIDRIGRDAIASLQGAVTADAAADAVSLYRRLARTSGSDRPAADASTHELGWALNCQSIVFSLELDGRKALFTGDMQFAEPGIRAIEDPVATLREKISRGGPYDFVKLAHHASHNAVDRDFLLETGCRAFAISGGIRDATHPDPSVLALLDSAQPPVRWARTDRNGRIKVTIGSSSVRFRKSRGSISDPSPNADSAVGVVSSGMPASREATTAAAVRPEGSPTAPPPAADTVEVVARVPHRKTRVVLTIDVQPGDESAGPTPQPAPGPGPQPRPEPPRSLPIGGDLPTVRVGGGRNLPRLLFLTDAEALMRNLGTAEATAALRSVQASGHTLATGTFSGRPSAEAIERARAQLASDPSLEGVVLLGGYDVVPARSLDVLTPEHRQRLGMEAEDEGDRFVVWSDDAYGDRDGDGFPELPVSRIPDGRSPDLVFAAHEAGRANGGRGRAGLRNVRRPFAEPIFAALPGSGVLLVSEPVAENTFPAGAFGADLFYLMLHGYPDNGVLFSGETLTPPRRALPAFHRRHVPPCSGGIVLTGCCWGALTVETLASEHSPGEPLAPRTPEASIALAFLLGGANAFVGCTGSHYSPIEPPFGYYGGPLHEAFWSRIVAGEPPARALLAAKKVYAPRIPYPGSGGGPADAAIEKKILFQFTCLGLGW